MFKSVVHNVHENSWKLLIPLCKNNLNLPMCSSFFSALCMVPPAIVYHFQGRNEVTSNVAFDVPIINCQILFINSFIFNCITLNMKLFIFKLFDVKFLFSENHVFRKQKRTAVYGVMDAHFLLNKKLMTCYLRDINKFLRYDTLCKSILKCGILTKSIELTRFVLFEILGVPQL